MAISASSLSVSVTATNAKNYSALQERDANTDFSELVARLRRVVGLQPYDHMWLENPSDLLEAVTGRASVYRCHPLFITLGASHCGGFGICGCDCHSPESGRETLR